MPTIRQYATNAARQAAYRARRTGQIPAGVPGYNAAGHTVTCRMVCPDVEPGSTTLWQVSAVVSAPNVITVTTWSPNAGSPIKANVNDGTVIDLTIF